MTQTEALRIIAEQIETSEAAEECVALLETTSEYGSLTIGTVRDLISWAADHPELAREVDRALGGG